MTQWPEPLSSALVTSGTKLMFVVRWMHGRLISCKCFTSDRMAIRNSGTFAFRECLYVSDPVPPLWHWKWARFLGRTGSKRLKGHVVFLVLVRLPLPLLFSKTGIAYVILFLLVRFDFILAVLGRFSCFVTWLHNRYGGDKKTCGFPQVVKRILVGYSDYMVPLDL